MTDAEGTYHLEIDLMYVNTDQLVCRASLPDIVIGDRLQIADFGINIPALLFPHPGRYEFRLRMNNRVIAQKISMSSNCLHHLPPNQPRSRLRKRA